MKIVFWSNVRGQNGTTSNMAGISVMSALKKKHRIILMENHYNINNLENAFSKRRNSDVVREEDYFYNERGLDHLMKQLHVHLDMEHSIEKSVITLLEDSFYYIPQGHITNKEYLEYELNRVIHPLFQKLEQFVDVVYIDTASSDALSSKTIIDQADLVVVNLCQNPYVLSNFFRNYSSIREKAVYLIGNYHSDSKFNLRNIMRKYLIGKERIAVIPHNVNYADALSEGRVIPFLIENYDCNLNSENYYFMEQLDNAVRMIEKNVVKKASSTLDSACLQSRNAKCFR